MEKELTQEKKDRIVKQSMNIRITEAQFEHQLVDSDGDVIESTPYRVGVVFNLEIISEEEVHRLLKTEEGRKDPRILIADIMVLKNIFPHMGEMENENGQK